MPTPTGKGASPTDASERYVALDALRGVALFGVLLENILTEFRVSTFERFLPGARASAVLADRVVARALSLGLESTAFILFSLLFGVGLAAQQERLTATPRTFAARTARRLGFLLVLGALHFCFVWSGDILTLYALVGVLAAPLLGASPRALVSMALALFVVQLLPLPYPAPFASVDALRAHVLSTYQVYRAGSYGDAVVFRVHEIGPRAALMLWSAPRTLALMLLGAAAWREGTFTPRARARALVGTAVVGLALGGAAAWALDAGVPLGGLRSAAVAWGPVGLALGYGAALLLLFRWAPVGRCLALLAPLGRMALTSYVTQSVVLGAIFYGWGLGLFGTLGEARAATIGIGLYAAQAVCSAWWLRAFRLGPLEWLWRWATYGARPALRR